VQLLLAIVIIFANNILGSTFFGNGIISFFGFKTKKSKIVVCAMACRAMQAVSNKQFFRRHFSHFRHSRFATVVLSMKIAESRKIVLESCIMYFDGKQVSSVSTTRTVFAHFEHWRVICVWNRTWCHRVEVLALAQWAKELVLESQLQSHDGLLYIFKTKFLQILKQILRLEINWKILRLKLNQTCISSKSMIMHKALHLPETIFLDSAIFI
jgi:hypothetical protein